MPDGSDGLFIYLDTNVLLDTVDNRRPASTQLLDRIRDSQWSAITSPFSLLEMHEAKQADRWAERLLVSGFTFFQIQRRLGERRTGRSALSRAELNNVYQDLMQALDPLLDIVTFPEMTAGLLTQAENVCASTNIDAPDSLHLATALYYGSDMFVTSDTTLVRLARPYVIATTPEGFREALEQYQEQTSSE